MQEELEKKDLDRLVARLGYTFSDPDLLKQALTHSSYANEKGLSPLESNERLEFLGDSVIEIAITGELFSSFPGLTEGELTRVRAFLVRKRTLAEVAKVIELGEHLLLGKGEEATGGRRKPSIVADALEALMGAIYLDGGFDAAKNCALRLLGAKLGDAVRGELRDYKSKLQEMTARANGIVPQYQVSEEGPAHAKTFHAEVRVGERRFGPGSGNTKKEAEQEAARIALREMGI